MKLVDILEKYCERIEKELEDQIKKIDKLNPLPPAEVDITDKLLHSMKSIKTTLAMLEYNDEEDDGYSGKYEPVRRRYTERNYSGRNDGGYSGRRDNRGYSRDSEKHDAIRKLEDMLDRARTNEEADAIHEALSVMNRI